MKHGIAAYDGNLADIINDAHYMVDGTKSAML